MQLSQELLDMPQDTRDMLENYYTNFRFSSKYVEDLSIHTIIQHFKLPSEFDGDGSPNGEPFSSCKIKLVLKNDDDNAFPLGKCSEINDNLCYSIFCKFRLQSFLGKSPQPRK